MSRLAASKPLPAAKRGPTTTSQDGELHSSLDRMKLAERPSSSSHTNTPSDPLQRAPEVCPVCKSSRYLNNSLRFLVNPECYHKMCESCVDRIFSHGPAKCPIPGCQHTLRKNRFREQTFEDIQVEREVDIRRRVAAVFNRREEEFESLRDYNDYLNEVEDITFNMINRIDLEATNKRFETYRAAHEKEILQNAQLAQKESQSFAESQKAERVQARQRREAARREEEEEKREEERNRQDMLNRLAAGQDAEQVQQVQLKKRMDRQAAAARQRQLQAASTVKNGPLAATNGSSDLFIKGLRGKQKQRDDEPVDPFGGLRFGEMRYYTLQDEYVWDVVQDAKKDVKISTGGYEVGVFNNRALVEAFAGLGVFVQDEMMEREKSGQDDEVLGTKSAETGVQDAKMAGA